MTKNLLFIIIIFFFVSCTRDKSIEPEKNAWCGTTTVVYDTLFHKNIIKLQVDGFSIPDSVDFMSNTIYTMYGSRYFKRFRNPVLTLTDSSIIIAKYGNDLSIIIYNSDTTKMFISKIFINNTLQIQQTGKTNSISKLFTTNHNF